MLSSFAAGSACVFRASAQLDYLPAGIREFQPAAGDIHGRLFGHRLTATPLSITLVIVIFGLIPVALWLWMARAVGHGRNWARILSTVLFVQATLELQGEHGGLSVFLAWVTWLTGLAVVCQLWRPASRAFFKRYPVRADHAGRIVAWLAFGCRLDRRVRPVAHSGRRSRRAAPRGRDRPPARTQRSADETSRGDRDLQTRPAGTPI